jgi:hypothetical protein
VLVIEISVCNSALCFTNVSAFLLPEEESGSQSEMRAQLDIPSVCALKAVICFNGTQNTRGNCIIVESKSLAAILSRARFYGNKYRISSLHISHARLSGDCLCLSSNETLDR